MFCSKIRFFAVIIKSRCNKNRKSTGTTCKPPTCLLFAIFSLRLLTRLCVHNIRNDHMHVSNFVVAQTHKHETGGDLSVRRPRSAITNSSVSIKFNVDKWWDSEHFCWGPKYLSRLLRNDLERHYSIAMPGMSGQCIVTWTSYMVIGKLCQRVGIFSGKTKV